MIRQKGRIFVALLASAFMTVTVVPSHAQRLAKRSMGNSQQSGVPPRPDLSPAGELEFTTPDSFGGAALPNNMAEAARAAFVSSGARPLRMFIAAKDDPGAEQFAIAEAFEVYEFDIPYAFRFTEDVVPGLPRISADIRAALDIDDRFRPKNTPIRAQIAGQMDIAGYLALIGVGQARATVEVAVLDVGEYGTTETNPANHRAIRMHKVLEKQITTSYSPEFGFSFGLQGGSDFEGVSSGVQAQFEYPHRKLHIREADREFGFDVLLRRGRRYRIETKLLGQVEVHAAGSGLADAGQETPRAIASFWYGATSPVGNLMDFAFDFSGINLSDRFYSYWSSFDLNTFKLSNIMFAPPSFYMDVNDVLQNGLNIAVPISDPIGIPEEDFGLDGLSRLYFADSITRAIAPTPPNLPAAGVTTDSLMVTLEFDQVEFMDNFHRRKIEEHVSEQQRLLTLKTPALDPNLAAPNPWNGSYELARDLVIQAIEGYRGFVQAACITTAITNLQNADNSISPNDGDPTNDNYDFAFRELRDAYVAIRDCP